MINTFFVRFVKKRFCHDKDRRRHRRNIHNINDNDDNNRDLRQDVNELRQRLDNLPAPQVQFQIQNTTNNYIHINGLGKEDLQKVTSALLTNCLRELPDGDGVRSIRTLIDIIHMKTEGNRNVRLVTGDKSGLVLNYFDDEKNDWQIDAKEKILHQMISRPRQLLKEHFIANKDTFCHEFSNSLYDLVERWFSWTKNKRGVFYKNIMNKVFEFIKSVDEQLTQENIDMDDV